MKVQSGFLSCPSTIAQGTRLVFIFSGSITLTVNGSPRASRMIMRRVEWKWRELNSHLEFKKLNIATGLDCLVFSENSLKAIKIRNFLFLL